MTTQWRSFFSGALIVLACFSGPLSEMLRLAEAPRKAEASAQLASAPSLEFATCFLNLQDAGKSQGEKTPAKKPAPATRVKVISGDLDSVGAVHVPAADSESAPPIAAPSEDVASPIDSGEIPERPFATYIPSAGPARGPPSIA